MITSMKTAYQHAEQTLKQKHVEGASLAARALLEKVCHKQWHELVTQQELSWTTQYQNAFEQLVARRLKGEPLQYLLEQVTFHDVTLAVGQACLIPRPETEELVEAVLQRVRAQGTLASLDMLDLATGSGCIAIALAKALPQSRWVASDISAEAITLAEHNAKQNQVAHQIQFVTGKDFQALPAGCRFDWLISNPPYLSEKEWRNAQKELQFEPKQALVAGELGETFYERIIPRTKAHLAPGGWLAFEIGATQGPYVRQQLLQQGFLDVEVVCDLSGHERFVFAQNNMEQ